MIDSFDYKEPSCALCGGKDFYYPKADAPKGRIPVMRIIEKLENCYNKDDMLEAGRLLEYWQEEAKSLLDMQGELSIVNEMLGHYRKVVDEKKGLLSVDRALFLIESLDKRDDFSSATIYLNMATTLKAFNKAKESIQYYDKAFSIYSLNLDKAKDYLAGYYNNRATALCDLGDFNGAEECYNLALKNLSGDNIYTDGAITYINLAHLFDRKNEREKVVDCLFKANELLNDEKAIKNGYYAFVLKKVAPSFRQFGFSIIADDFMKIAGEIYERT